ncbi:helix-turn-helix transcriptional regulator [Globicatella sanguinis]
MPYTTQQTYSKWETGKSKPTIDKIPKISKVLEIPITSLFR